MLTPINTAVFSFENLIRDGNLYVDKTSYIAKLLQSGKGIYFLSRPRRFGKSLFLSTLDAFFSGKKELFKGLAIESLVPTDWEQYPVIRLDMASVAAQDVETLEANLQNSLGNIAISHGISSRGPNAKAQFANCIIDLVQKTGKQVVILIDEYDKPILNVIGKPIANAILEHLRNFYQEIKSANEKERFVFITGVTKFAHTSIFSDLNNLTDITRSADYATMLGYTHEELLDNFSEYIDDTAKFLGKTRENLIKELTDWYDGFRFEETSKSVFNPVSIGKFFINKKFNNYWYDTGTPRFLVEVAKKKPLYLECYLGKPISYSLFDKYDIDDLSPFVFAVQTGYLTIKDSVKVDDVVQYIMGYPNREIRDCFRDFLFGVYTKTSPQEAYLFTERLSASVEQGDVDSFLEDIQPIFSGLAYENIAAPKTRAVYFEGYFRNVLATIFAVLSKNVEPEIQTSNGRIDLVVRVKEWTFIFELKMLRDGQDTDTLLDSALYQAIEEKHYADKYRNLSKHIKIVAVVFDADSRKLVAWKDRDVK